MGGLAESAPELTAEVGGRKARSASEVADIQRLRVASIDQVPGP